MYQVSLLSHTVIHCVHVRAFRYLNVLCYVNRGLVSDVMLFLVASPSMWTRKDIKDFKDAIRKEPDSVIKVGSGETVTVSACALLYVLQRCYF